MTMTALLDVTPELQNAFRAVFRAWFGLTPVEADILAALYKARGEPRMCADLAQAADIPVRTVKTRICGLRSALDTEAIDTVAGGYQLTEVGTSECRAAIWTIGEELRKAGLAG